MSVNNVARNVVTVGTGGEIGKNTDVVLKVERLRTSMKD
jgi:uncharacterized NAD-dependent epimerase/dehydratase family protein